ncbi:hypothetical protein F2Q68_00027202 [Brassica cretica]|uniref:Shikimate kinase n=1 Tax=Brassica cretica TaxID=69181 RepID=A0A8S9I9W6_BRACR|nr:hypothetical protein F2Q68_00027202 [Brassica cretica]
MEAAIAQRVQYPTWVDCRKFEGKPLGSLRYSQRVKEEKRFRGLVALAHLQPDRRYDQRRSVSSERKAEEVIPYLNGRSMYLVGMMGSGKTTVGKLMSKVLGYSFFDCDTLIEQAMNGASVAEIFEHHGESFFRGKEV